MKPKTKPLTIDELNQARAEFARQVAALSQLTPAERVQRELDAGGKGAGT